MVSKQQLINMQKLTERQEESLVKMYQQAFVEAVRLSKAIKRSDLERIMANPERVHYVSIMRQLKELLIDLDERALRDLKILIPQRYELGKLFAEHDLNKLGITDLTRTMSMIDKNAISSIIQDTYEDLARATANVEEYFKRAIREATQEEVFKNVLTGRGMEISKEELKNRLEQQGMTAFVKKNGARLNLESYSEMVIRTKTMKAHNTGNLAMIVQNGFDLVQISSHSNSCKKCIPYQGKIYSISGTSKKYPPLSSINGGPPFHVNCRHVSKPYIEGYD